MKTHYIRIVLGIIGLFYGVYQGLQKAGNMPIVIPEAVAGYQEYTPETDFSQISDDRIVLFFHADRCSSCKVIEKDIQEKGVPDGIQIYEVDFDQEKELLEKYNVLTQSSFAEIDTDGALIKRRVGGFGIDDIVEKLNDNEVKPWEVLRRTSPPAPLLGGEGSKMVDTNQPKDLKLATFAGGCFWCIEGPFEAMEGIDDAVSGYAGGSEETASYAYVGRGTTDHREAVQVEYDANIHSYAELVETFLRQIDPTDAGGQFADRGFHYTTAIYTHDDEQKEIAERMLAELDASGKFDQPIVVKVEPYTTFFRAEEDHQDYYLKQSSHYQRYKKGSGRAGYIEENWESEKSSPSSPLSSREGLSAPTLTDLQRKVIFEEGTEPPFQNKYRDHKEAGIYVDVLDGTPLFSSTDKFDSGTGRPSFTQPIEQTIVDFKEDKKFGMVRTEVETANNTHLGHVFNDGPGGTQRYCINSAALDFVPLEKMEELGYGEYVELFE